jgi:hypothetical protein
VVAVSQDGDNVLSSKHNRRGTRRGDGLAVLSLYFSRRGNIGWACGADSTGLRSRFVGLVIVYVAGIGPYRYRQGE